MRRGHGSLYDIAVPGYKANLSDVLAAIALCQLDKLERHREIRLRHVEAYDEAVAALEGIEPLARDPRDLHALHLYVVRVDPERAGATRDEYQRALAEEQIGTSIHFLPVHRLSAYRDRFPEQPALPVAERAGDEVLSLPLSPAHSDDDIADAIDALRRVHARFSRGQAREAAPQRARPRDARRHRPVPRVHRLEDRHRADARHPRRRRLLVPRGRGGDHDGDGAADGVALAAAAAGSFDRRRLRLADPRVLRRLHGGADPADGRGRRRGADLRDVAAAPGRGGPIAGSVLLERALGGSATLALAAVGFALALGEYDVGAYLWIELAFVVATVLLAVAVFSRSARRPLSRTVPLLRWLRVERPIRAVYEGVHAYRAHTRLLIGVFALTLAIQAVRVMAIWCTGKAVGIDLSPRVYYVMGPLLFLVMLVPFTINGLAVREAFFVSFLGQLGVSADAAFAAGFLFFLVTIAMAVPGALVLAWEGLRRPQSPSVPMADRLTSRCQPGTCRLTPVGRGGRLSRSSS